MKKEISRRQFLRLAAGGTTVAVMAACTTQAVPVPGEFEAEAPGSPSQETPAPAGGAASGTYNEAPMLAERVAAGDLPPVDERLPEAPVVIEPVERIGTYGGDWNTALLGAADTAWLTRTIGYEHLVRWDEDFQNVMPNLAESFEVSDDGTVFTFHLRPGLKWSDGEPFTADDLVFWYEDVFMNDELIPVKNAWLVSGEPAVVEKVDDQTVTFTFAEPAGLFLFNLATPSGNFVTNYPRHYMEQFHPTYNENAAQLAEEEGFDTWVSLFENKANAWTNAEKPVVHGWQMVIPLAGDNERVVAERNPYYWKVDPEGNQLPYLDRVVYTVTADMEVMVLRGLNGDIDMQDRHIATMANKPLFFDGMEAGNYRLFNSIPSDMNRTVIGLNMNHADPMKREIFQNKDFRIGLSHAINRQEIIDLIYQGQGTPWQLSPRPETQLYHERLATMYTEYDVDLANEHLDIAGFSERDAEGFRLGPDGNRLHITIDLTRAEGPEWPDVAALVKDYWEAVGISMEYREMDRSLLDARRLANEHDASIYVGFGGGPDIQAILDPRWYMPHHAEDNAYLWTLWYNNDPRGEEPPEIVKQQMALYDELTMTVDWETQLDLMRQILDIAAEMFYGIGIVLPDQGYGIVKNNFRNVPDTMPASWYYPTPAPTHTVQYFKEE